MLMSYAIACKDDEGRSDRRLRMSYFQEHQILGPAVVCLVGPEWWPRNSLFLEESNTHGDVTQDTRF